MEDKDLVEKTQQKENKMNSDDELKRMFRKQLNVQLLFNLFNTIVIVIFIIIFRKNRSVLYFLIALIVVMWAYVGLKMLSLRKTIKRLEKENKKTMQNK